MVVAPLAIDLFVILACLGAIVIILCAKTIVTALFQVGKSAVGWIPWLGKKAAGGLDKVEQRLVSALADQVNGLQGVVGTFWHAFGNLISSIGHEIYGLAVAVNNFGAYMHGVVRPWVLRTITQGLQHGIKWLRHETTVIKTQVYRVTKVIEHPVHTKIGGAVRTITRPFKAALHHIEAVELPGLRARTRGLEDRLARDIAGVRSLVHGAERVNGRLWAKIRRLDRITTGALATALVATAVGKLGGGWIFCRNWRSVGRSVCRSPGHLIDDLLGLVTDFVVLTNICTILPWLEDAASTIGAPMISALSKAGAGVCHGSAGPLPDLQPPQTYRPANPSIFPLHLP